MLKGVRNLHMWEDKDDLALTQLLFIYAIRDTTLTLTFGFNASPSPIVFFTSLSNLNLTHYKLNVIN